MAIGVGLTTAMFALADPYLLRPLPYPGNDELVWMTVRARGLTADATLPAFDDGQRRTDLFKGLAAVQGPSFHRLRLSDRGAIAVKSWRSRFAIGRSPRWCSCCSASPPAA